MGPDYPEGLPPPTPEQPPAADLKTTMREVMSRLEERNRESGGGLFGIFGNGEARVFVFNTPNSREVQHTGRPETRNNEFLAVTELGFKLIQIHHEKPQGPKYTESSWEIDAEQAEESLIKFIENRQQNIVSGEDDDKNYIGYRKNSLVPNLYEEREALDLETWQTSPTEEIEWVRLGDTKVSAINVGSNRSSYFGESGGPGPGLHIATLVTTPGPDVVASIVKLNIERQEKERQEALLKVSTNPQQEAAQKVLEILG